VSKNSNGEGSIYKRMKDGKLIRYEGQISYIDRDGNRKRHTVYGRTRKDVRDGLDKVRDRLDAGAPARDAATTVAAWLQHWRGTVLEAAAVKPSTRDLYARLSRVHLDPAPFGGIRLDRLKPSDIDLLMVTLRGKTKPGPDGTDVPALSDNTRRLIYVVLRHSIDAAVRDGLIARNPALAVARPRVERKEAKHLDAAQVQALLTAAKPSRHYPVLALIAATGMRKGEALALQWDRVNLDDGRVTIAATLSTVGGKPVLSEPKTARSRRTVPIPPAVVALLRRHKTKQTAERLRAGNQWADRNLVFPTELGGPTDPGNVLETVHAAAKRAGIDDVVGVHTLRHSAAVGWLESGTHVRAVADLLGHSSVATTADVYLHSSDAVTRAAVDNWGTALEL
jgi:integrase